MSKETDAFYVITADLPSENFKFLNKDKTDTEEQAKEKREYKTRLGRLRIQFMKDLNRYGRHVNRSVFLVPKCTIKKAKNLVTEYEKKYDPLIEEIKDKYSYDIFENNSIDILQFDKTETIFLRNKAREAFEEELDKLCDKLDERLAELSRKEKNANKRTIKKFNETVDEFSDLLKSFKLDRDNELNNLLDQVAIKVNDLKKLGESRDDTKWTRQQATTTGSKNQTVVR